MTRIKRTTWLPVIGGCLLVAAVGCGPAQQAEAPPTTGHDMSGMTHDMPGMDHDMPGMQHDMSGMQQGDASGAAHHGPGGAEIWSVDSVAGDVATDGSGRILYRSDADGTKPPVSRCVGACTQEWQPFTVPAGQRPDTLGVDDRKVGTLKRPDGAVQVTMGGSPLYTNRGDQGQMDAPVSVAGWHAVNPTGATAAKGS